MIPPIAPPTIAEVREVLERRICRCTLCSDSRALLARLDPETQVIVDRGSLAAALSLLNSLGIAGPNIRHRQLTQVDFHDLPEWWAGPIEKITEPDEWCVCGRILPCEAQHLGDLLAALGARS